MKKNILFLLLFLCACADDNHEYTTVKQGAFKTTLTETGELQAAQYTIISMPAVWRYGRPKISHLEPEGTRVQKGSVVGEIEPSGVIAERGRLENTLAIEQANLNTLHIQQDSKIKELNNKIQSAQSALTRAHMNQQRVRFESQTNKTIKTLELTTKQLTLQKLQSQLESLRIQQAEELSIQLAKIQKIESNIENANRTLEIFTLRASSPGIIEYRQNGRTRQKVAIGDQLWSGAPIIGLPDLSRMKAHTTINETDINKITKDQKVTVKLDAFPKFIFEGQIVEISRISRQKSRNDKSKVFDVEILLKDSHDLLRPGMTVSCEFLIADFENALFVNNDCIQKKDNQYVVYIKNMWGLTPIPVELGPRNANNIVIKGDIKPGAQVVLGGAT